LLLLQALLFRTNNNKNRQKNNENNNKTATETTNATVGTKKKAVGLTRTKHVFWIWRP
jgi:hypothetical protein